MSGYVVDASVAVKWLVTEALSDQADLLLTDDQRLIAPDLLYAEATNALWAMHRRGSFSRAELEEALHLLEACPIAVPHPMRRLAAAAGRLAAELQHPAYDCFYLALALQEQLPVVTADARFHDAVSALPFLSDRIVHLKDL